MKPTSILAGVGLGAVVLVAIAYLLYVVGLILVLKRLGKLNWMAFVPILNYLAQLRAINAPTRWFAFAFLPYVGVVYAGSVAIRLGAVFGKDPAFSLFWLTLGSPIGMFMLARPNLTIHHELSKSPPPCSTSKTSASISSNPISNRLSRSPRQCNFLTEFTV